MKFVCLGYLDQSTWDGKSEDERRRLINECFDYDEELRRGGHFLGGEALGSSSNAVRLRMKNGQGNVSDGPFTEAKEVSGGILLLEARDLQHAIALMSKHPGAQVGPWEIRAADEQVNALITDRETAAGAEKSEQGKSTYFKSTLHEALTFSYEWIKPLADDLADAPMTSPTPMRGNHPLWIMGHLTYSTAGLLAMISGESNPYEKWKNLFAGGTQPLSDAASYPSYAEILEAYEATYLSGIGILNETTDSQLNEPPTAVPDALRDYPSFQTTGKLFVFIAMHEMSHRGQLADARRVLGRTPLA